MCCPFVDGRFPWRKGNFRPPFDGFWPAEKSEPSKCELHTPRPKKNEPNAPTPFFWSLDALGPRTVLQTSFYLSCYSSPICERPCPRQSMDSPSLFSVSGDVSPPLSLHPCAIKYPACESRSSRVCPDDTRKKSRTAPPHNQQPARGAASPRLQFDHLRIPDACRRRT